MKSHSAGSAVNYPRSCSPGYGGTLFQNTLRTEPGTRKGGVLRYLSCPWLRPSCISAASAVNQAKEDSDFT